MSCYGVVIYTSKSKGTTASLIMLITVCTNLKNVFMIDAKKFPKNISKIDSLDYFCSEICKVNSNKSMSLSYSFHFSCIISVFVCIMYVQCIYMLCE